MSKEAIFKLGKYQQFGYGIVEPNIIQAIKYYESAAADGHIESMNALGMVFSLRKEYEQAAEWFKKASERGYTRALNNLGICYEEGLGVDKDFDEA